ncbi:uncharacterized protein N7529_008746 [Penicillium soppii]|uniref:uncharacterized protein n=1 Tax=Penicillium soppii TaxID=69789 RepID=UPI002546FACA|nr:uncharacterized protein N7529_008746 [Penicillium soppii]KAJ5861436.1 hypothetical protein N7529_008746 [Penicillium soppii]
MAMENIMKPTEWGKSTEVEAKRIESVDGNFKAKSPPGILKLKISPHSTSYWTKTARISAEKADGQSRRRFFLKASKYHLKWLGMIFGEHASMVALYNALPEFVPAPVGYGAYASNPDIHFFLSEFLNMMGEIPEIRIFIETPAKLHTKGISSEGEYGFDLGMHDKWEESFYHSLKWFMTARCKLEAARFNLVSFTVTFVYDAAGLHAYNESKYYSTESTSYDANELTAYFFGGDVGLETGSPFD